MSLRILRVISLCLCVLVAANPVQTQTKANQLIDQMIDALGGQTFLDVKDIHTTGRFFAFTRGQLSGFDIFSEYIKLPDMERVEFGPTTRRTTQINRGKEGWKIVAKKSPEPQSPGEIEEFLKGLKTSLDYVLRFTLEERQTTVQPLPSEMIDFKRIDVVELRDPEKNRIRFYIDRDTHLPIKMQVRRTEESKLHEEQYSNWHKFQGAMTPMYVSRLTDGVKTMEIHLDTAVYDSGLSDNL